MAAADPRGAAIVRQSLGAVLVGLEEDVTNGGDRVLRPRALTPRLMALTLT